MFESNPSWIVCRRLGLATGVGLLIWIGSRASIGLEPDLVSEESIQPPSHPPGYVCGKTKGLIVVDGKLDEKDWADATWSDAFIDIEGERKPKPRHNTRVKLLWNDKYLYIGAWLEEPNVWAVLNEHDSVVFMDNDFEVFIDPDGDRQHYFEIEVNALGTEWDLFLDRSYRDQGNADNNWEIPGLQIKTSVDGTINDWNDLDHGWYVEAAVPWESMEYRDAHVAVPKEGEQWRINFSRVEWTVLTTPNSLRKRPGNPEDNWVWAPQGVVDMHRPEHWGYVQFTSGEPAKTTFRRDETIEARLKAAAVYNAQLNFRRTHDRWASSLLELGLTFSREDGLIPSMQTKQKGFVISCPVGTRQPGCDGPSRSARIDSNGKMWVEQID